MPKQDGEDVGSRGEEAGLSSSVWKDTGANHEAGAGFGQAAEELASENWRVNNGGVSMGTLPPSREADGGAHGGAECFEIAS